MYLYIGIVTIVIYLALQYFDDQRNLQLHKPPSSTSLKLAMLFFSFIITTVMFHFFWNLEDTEVNGGYSAPENSHLKYIQQEVEVGLPDF
jgi:uncharacterized membrane protein YwzB